MKVGFNMLLWTTHVTERDLPHLKSRFREVAEPGLELLFADVSVSGRHLFEAETGGQATHSSALRVRHALGWTQGSPAHRHGRQRKHGLLGGFPGRPEKARDEYAAAGGDGRERRDA